MKTKLIILLAAASLLLQACTINIWRYQHWDFGNGVPVYKLVYTYRQGAIEPIVNIIDPTRQMTPR